MRVIQVTDLHIPPLHADTKGVNIKANVEAVVRAIKNEPADAILFTGDFCYKAPTVEAYEWLYQQVATIDTPCYFLPGNHDDLALMRQHLSLDITSDEYYYKVEINGVYWLFLDSSKATMSERQLEWLTTQLSSSEGIQFISTHYPLHQMGVPFMDENHCFQESTKLTKILCDTGIPIHLFVGHYHCERTSCRQNLHTYVTPSLFCQIHPDKSSFEVDSYLIGYRVIEHTNDQLFTSVRYMPGHSF